MSGQQEYRYIGEKRSVEHHSQDHGPGEVTATIVDYEPEMKTRGGRFCEWSLVQLTFRSASGTRLDQHVAMMLTRTFRHFRVTEGRRWVFEAWAYDADESGDPVGSNNGSYFTPFDFSQPSADSDLTMGKLLDELLESAYYYF